MYATFQKKKGSVSQDPGKDQDMLAGHCKGLHVHKSDRKIGHRRVGEGGEITYKKIQSSQIMGSIQLGIQHAIGGLASKPERDLLMQDFMTVETTNFPHEGSNHTPAHHYSEFKFKTYAPIAFRYFRDLFGIQPDDFLMSMCSAPLRELSNPGASGSIFYLTNDDEFIIKTVQHKEGEFLQKLLPGYYLNLDQNPRTLLPKFFGLYCYQCNSKNVRLVAMNNILPSSVKLHQKYDLKGSTYKRKASKTERQKNSPTYKDLDFMEHNTEGLFLEADTYNALIKTMQRDCRVLESFKIMDYSLLVGIHNLDEAQREKTEARKRTDSGQSDGDDAEGDSKRSGLNRTRSINRQRLVAHSTAMESIQAESEPIDEEEDVPPGGIPARNARGERLLLFLGIIDILQSYRLRKKLEHTWKSMIHDGDTVSVHRPSFYAQRFLDFMAKTVFKKIPSYYNPDYLRQSRLSPKSSVRSSLSDFTDTTISTWNQRHPAIPAEYPSVLSDRLKIIDRERFANVPRRIEFDTSNLGIREPGTSYADNVYRASIQERMESLSDQLTKVLSTGAGSSQINGSLADSGIQTDNTSTSVPQIYVTEAHNYPVVKILKDAAVDTRNENNLQDIPFIDDEEDEKWKRRSNFLEKHKSMSNIPERIDEDSSQEHSNERLTNSLNRAKSPTFVEKFKQFFVDIGLVKTESVPNTENIANAERDANTLPKSLNSSYRTRSTTPTKSLEARETATLPKDMRFRKVRSTQTVYIKQESPLLKDRDVQTNEHVSVTTSDADIAFPAVLKGSQKQRVPPPVPPRGSPKAKRGTATSQSSSLDIKGDFIISISTNEIPPGTSITSSEDEFNFLGHDLIFNESTACIPPCVSEHSIKITKLDASNSFLDYVEDADSITERSHRGKDLIAQKNMMAKFNMDKAREYLDTGNYDDTSLTESSSDGKSVMYEAKEKVELKTSRSPTEFIKDVVTTISDKLTRKPPELESTEKVSVHNIKSSDLITAAKTLKKVTTNINLKESLEKDMKPINIDNDKQIKPGLISGLTKKLNFNQSKRDKSRNLDKLKPKVEIRTYVEGKSKGGMTKDEVVCHKKAKTRIDMFQKQIFKVQSDSETSSRRSSISSSQDSRSVTAEGKKIVVKETKKIFEPIEYSYGSSSSVDKKHFSFKNTAISPVVSSSITGNVNEKIKKFSEISDSDYKTPEKVPRQKKKGIVMLVSNPAGAPMSCCSTPPPPFEEAPPPRTSRTNSSSTTSSSASGRRRGASSAASVMTTSSASSLALTATSSTLTVTKITLEASVASLFSITNLSGNRSIHSSLWREHGDLRLVLPSRAEGTRESGNVRSPAHVSTPQERHPLLGQLRP
ncbi:hypothetical protein K1T71_014128 [Dendrolimus kikuchii]|uniref:Uncharacterized protein n=1 Tax=Dendrolimus kikuchii TaxID=765133 RepID=A0ACC1CFC0_9NEOP|nr:hypothetical protein K1T71_014128 [Dendrolimus kikuchii]